MKFCEKCGSCTDKKEKALPSFAAEEGDDTDLKSSVLDELISLMDGHAGEKLTKVKKPKAVSVEVLSVGKPKDEDDDDSEV